MSNRILIITGIVFLSIILGSCKKSTPTEPVTPTSYINFLYYGAVVPNPVSTLITFEPENIKYVSSKNGIQISCQDTSHRIQSSHFHHR